MTEKWERIKLKDIIQTNVNTYSLAEKWDFVNYLDTGNLTEDEVDEYQHIIVGKNKLPSRARRKVKLNDILYSTVRPNQLHYGIVKNIVPNMLVSTGFTVITVDELKADSEFVYYFLTQNKVTEILHSIGEQSTSAYPSIKPSDIENLEIILPRLDTQRKIARILRVLDNKIENNKKLNHHLEQIIQCQFDYFINNANKKKITLYELASIIDNRGKTPPLVGHSNYPIIDVRTLTGDTRIIRYNNAQKYVSKTTYNNWFRNGHPRRYDTLISTVGSVGLVKLFLENKGVIAQNVVALRSKDNLGLFLYQLLLSLQKKLKEYDIGSVQPSIKVSQFMKQEVKIPHTSQIIEWEQSISPFVLQIENNSLELSTLVKIREGLLPKLMSGELNINHTQVTK